MSSGVQGLPRQDGKTHLKIKRRRKQRKREKKKGGEEGGEERKFYRGQCLEMVFLPLSLLKRKLVLGKF